MEMKLVLAVLLQKWRPELRPGIKIDCGGLMVSQPKNGLPVTLSGPTGQAPDIEVRGNIRELVRLDQAR
jgi:hypothetical protein